jgi:hypothetical protein
MLGKNAVVTCASPCTIRFLYLYLIDQVISYGTYAIQTPSQKKPVISAVHQVSQAGGQGLLVRVADSFSSSLLRTWSRQRKPQSPISSLPPPPSATMMNGNVLEPTNSLVGPMLTDLYQITM